MKSLMTLVLVVMILITFAENSPARCDNYCTVTEVVKPVRIQIEQGTTMTDLVCNCGVRIEWRSEGLANNVVVEPGDVTVHFVSVESCTGSPRWLNHQEVFDLLRNNGYTPVSVGQMALAFSKIPNKTPFDHRYVVSLNPLIIVGYNDLFFWHADEEPGHTYLSVWKIPDFSTNNKLVYAVRKF